jgi:hypothetical protein
MRHNGLSQTTYHTGEDYRHLASGIRAVWEAIYFLDLGSGDRVGHGVAFGVLPEVWRDVIGERLMLSREENLDNAVFCHRLLSSKPDHHQTIAVLRQCIDEESLRIYGMVISPDLLWSAWEMRKLDIIHCMEFDRNGFQWPALPPLHAYTASERELIQDAYHKNPLAFKLFLQYHTKPVRSAGRDSVEVNTSHYCDDSLRQLQNMVTSELNARKIAIETLPTSNVRIGHYDYYRQHHLFRWLGIPKAGYRKGEPMPTVCVGTDDTGIFATNLRNEYCHIVGTLEKYYEYSHADATVVARRLNQNGRVYAFNNNADV